MSLNKLEKRDDGVFVCPVCGAPLRYRDGGAVSVVDGHLDMESCKPRYICDTCKSYYREVLMTGCYEVFPLEEEAASEAAESETPAEKSEEAEAALPAEKPAAPRKVLATGDLAPMLLQKDENRQCRCPRCGEMMDYVEGQAVRIVDGKPDMENVWDHFVCESCHSVFRRIVNTDYFQFTER